MPTPPTSPQGAPGRSDPPPPRSAGGRPLHPELEVVSLPGDERPTKIVGAAHRVDDGTIMVRLHALPLGPILVIRERLDEQDAEVTP